MIVGSLLALMAFLLAVTMGMASDRFDGRRGVVLAEANAMSTAFLQADYLPDPAAGQLKDLLREYVPLRISPADPSQLPAMLERASALRDEMWAIEAEAVRSGYSPDLMSSLGGSLAELTTVSETRMVSVSIPACRLRCWSSCSSARSSPSAWSGYSAGLRERRSVLTALVLVAAMGAVLMLVIDLDRPQDGLINVSQQPILDVQAWMGPPSQ